MVSMLARCNDKKSSAGAVLQLASFDYNEIPTSSCQSFCWKARHRFDVPFFYVSHGLFCLRDRFHMKALTGNATSFSAASKRH